MRKNGVMTVSDDSQHDEPLLYRYNYKNHAQRPLGAMRTGDSNLPYSEDSAVINTPTTHRPPSSDYTKRFVTASSSATQEELKAAAVESAKERVLAINHKNEVVGEVPRKIMVSSFLMLSVVFTSG